mgnify:CR=1 FL=1
MIELNKTIEDLKGMTDTEVNNYCTTLYNRYRDRYPEMTYDVIIEQVKALWKTPQSLLPINDTLFKIVLKHCISECESNAYRGSIFRSFDYNGIFLYDSRLWLNDVVVRGCVTLTTESHTESQVLFLTDPQYEVLFNIRNDLKLLPEQVSWDETVSKYLNEAGISTDNDEEGLNDPAVQEIMDDFLLPPNSGVSNVMEHTSRFSSAVWFEEIQKKTVILAGLGGIGSYVAFLLARMQPKALFLFDSDTVENSNLSGQMYSVKDIGEYKVDAISYMVERYANYNSVFAVRENFTLNCEAADIMICGFDNMKARKDFFQVWFSHMMELSEEKRKHCLFIDGRLSAEYFQVYCIAGNDREAIVSYNSSLFEDWEADETVCSYKQTTYMANMIGSVITNLFTNFVANEVAGAPIRELPFVTEYDGTVMSFKTRV